jgi:hypothetical protein
MKVRNLLAIASWEPPNAVVDINDRMPRAEAEAIFQHIRPLGRCRYLNLFMMPETEGDAALAIDPKLSIDIMGSFRRYLVSCPLCLGETS